MRMIMPVLIVLFAIIGVVGAVDEVEIRKPVDGQTFDDCTTVIVRVRYIDDDGNGEIWARLWVDGELSGTNKLVGLGEGTHEITAEAADNEGYEGSIYSTVTITVVHCDDNDACTIDSCDPVLGCQHAAINCDDSDACTIDACDSVLGCQYEEVNCDDGDDNTIDTCDSVLGCQHAAIN